MAEAAVLLSHALPGASVARASISEPTLGVGDTSPLASLETPSNFQDVQGSFVFSLPLFPTPRS